MRELLTVEEEWNFDDEENQFVTATILVWKEAGSFFTLALPGRHRNFDLQNLSSPNPIPLAGMCCPWNDVLTEAHHDPIPGVSFVKPPKMGAYKEGGPNIGEMILAGAKIYEILSAKPHRNICFYHGCVRQGDYLLGICLKQYKHTLHDVVMRGSVSTDRSALIASIREGVRFLHSFGLVHNDLNPLNIMVDDEGVPVIIDFDLCKREGENLGEGTGTPPWSQNANIATIENDFYPLELIEKFVNGEYLTQVIGSPLLSMVEANTGHSDAKGGINIVRDFGD